jgi:hypothetical protein
LNEIEERKNDGIENRPIGSDVQQEVCFDPGTASAKDLAMDDRPDNAIIAFQPFTLD